MPKTSNTSATGRKRAKPSTTKASRKSTTTSRTANSSTHNSKRARTETSSSAAATAASSAESSVPTSQPARPDRGIQNEAGSSSALFTKLVDALQYSYPTQLRDDSTVKSYASALLRESERDDVQTFMEHLFQYYQAMEPDSSQHPLRSCFEALRDVELILSDNIKTLSNLYTRLEGNLNQRAIPDTSTQELKEDVNLALSRVASDQERLHQALLKTQQRTQDATDTSADESNRVSSRNMYASPRKGFPNNTYGSPNRELIARDTLFGTPGRFESNFGESNQYRISSPPARGNSRGAQGSNTSMHAALQQVIPS
eukprot:gb/GECG01001826.1/.p1 GENE.gb/GECG01001826.1/~~gb/GECG01001826.1/.p1  ORF type:complete len:314 (+),score=33.68 gb/GECG01001826.1/:1-942(+)